MKPVLSLRDLFWLVLLVAVGFVWWVDHRHWVRKYEHALWERDGAVTYAKVMEDGFKAAKIKLDECKMKLTGQH